MDAIRSVQSTSCACSRWGHIRNWTKNIFKSFALNRSITAMAAQLEWQCSVTSLLFAFAMRVSYKIENWKLTRFVIEDRRPVEHMKRRMLDGFLPTSSNVEVDGDDRRIGEEKSDNPIRLRERIQHDLLIQWQSTKGLVNNPNSLRVNMQENR